MKWRRYSTGLFIPVGLSLIHIYIFEEGVRRCHAKKGIALHSYILEQRQIWCEGSFAAQKARHNVRKLYRRGVEAAETHCLLSAMALNLKRMVKCLEWCQEASFFVSVVNQQTLGYVETVSYTHLDVYKRQPFPHFNRWWEVIPQELLPISGFRNSAELRGPQKVFTLNHCFSPRKCPL